MLGSMVFSEGPRLHGGRLDYCTRIRRDGVHIKRRREKVSSNSVVLCFPGGLAGA